MDMILLKNDIKSFKQLLRIDESQYAPFYTSRTLFPKDMIEKEKKTKEVSYRRWKIVKNSM